MWNKFVEWHENHQAEISWFIIGLFFHSLLSSKDITWSIVCLVMIAWNFLLYRGKK
jgi:hypothetical protein